MAKGMGYKIGFEGETEFMKAIKEMNAQLKTLQTEMKAVTSEFDKEDQSQEKLTAQNKVLNKQIDLQMQKVLAQQKVLQEAKEAYDENSVVVQKYAQDLNKAKADLNNMSRSLGQNEKALEGMSETATEAGDDLDGLSGEMQTGSSKADLFAAVLGGNLAAKGLEVVADAAVEATKKIAEFEAETDKAISMTQARLGATEDEAKIYGKVITDIYSDGFVESTEEAAEALSKVKQQLRDLPDEKLRDVSNQSVILEKVFDIDVQEGLRGADALMKQFGIDATTAYDLMTVGAQKGLNQNGDLADQIAEYSVYYADAGYSAEQMFAVMASGAESGVFQIDKVNDAIKELNINAKDKASEEAFQALGLNANQMLTMFAEGGEKAIEATKMVNTALFEMDDKVKQNEIGVALYKTKWEDLGIDAVYAMSQMETELGNVDGAALAAGEAMNANFSSQMQQLRQSVAAAVYQLVNEDITPEEFTQRMTEIMTRISDTISQNAPMVLDKGFELVEGLGESLAAAAPELVPDIIQMIVQIAETLIEHIPDVAAVAPQIVGGLAIGLINAIPDLILAVPKLLGAFAEAFEDYDLKIIQIGVDIVSGIFQGIKNGWKVLKEGFKGLLRSLVTDSEKELEIHSPSRVFRDRIGKQISAGVAVGIEEGTGEAVEAAETMAAEVVAAAEDMDSMIPFARKTAKKVGDVLKNELEKTNSQLEAMQKKANEEKAAQELKQYQDNLAKKHEELNKAEKKNKQKIQDEITKLESDWNKKQADAARTAEQKKLQEKISALQEFQREYESALSAIERKQDSLQGKLSDYGDLFERVKTEEGEELFQLGDLQDDIRQLEKYGEAIDKLKEKGISDGLMGEISGMGVDDALDYMNKLISMSGTKFDQYVELFAKKQQAAQGVAEKFYKEEFNALEQSYTEKLPETLEGVKAGMYQAGAEAAQSLKDGLQSDGTALGDAVATAVSDAVVGASEATQEENFQQITEGMAEQEPILTEYIEGLKETLISLIESYYGDFKDVGSEMMEGVAVGIENKRSRVVNAVAKVIADAVRRAKSDLDIHSPSKVFAEIGGYMAAGLDEGWQEKMKIASNNISRSLAAVSAPPMTLQRGCIDGNGSHTYTYGDINVYVDTVNNGNDRDVQRLATELEFYRRQQETGRGGSK